jgi:uroporphyrinogen-III synthase
MRVLVTRPEEDAEETAEKLAARGHEAIIAPLLEIQFREGGDVALDGVQAVLVTSANGIRALAGRTQRRDVRVLAVGAQSAETARELGFAEVEHAAGDAQALAELAIAKLSPPRGALLHVSADIARASPLTRLAGFRVHTAILYDAVARMELPDSARDALAKDSIDAVLFFSPRTAKIFVELVALAGLAEKCRPLRAFCISQAAADELSNLAFREVRVAAQPNQDALLTLLDR